MGIEISIVKGNDGGRVFFTLQEKKGGGVNKTTVNGKSAFEPDLNQKQYASQKGQEVNNFSVDRNSFCPV